MAYVMGMILCLVSCTRDIVMDAGDESVVVVEFVLSNDPVQTLHLSYSRSPSDSVTRPVAEAFITLTNMSNGFHRYVFVKGHGDEWTLEYQGIPGDRYRLTVEIPGHETIVAEDRMPDSLYVSYRHGVFYYPYGNDTGLKFQSTLYRLTNQKNHVWVTGMNYYGEDGSRHVADYICTDYPGVDMFNVTGACYDGDPRWINLDEVVPGPAVQWIPYEHECGSMGWWAAAAPQLIGKSFHDRRLRFPKESFDRDASEDQEGTPYCEFVIVGSFTENYHFGAGDDPSSGQYFGDRFGYYHWDGTEGRYVLDPFTTNREPMASNGYLLFMAVSDSYDGYLAEAVTFKALLEGSDLSEIYRRENMNSNIIGGIGFFGCCTAMKLPCFNGYNNDGLKAWGWERNDDGTLTRTAQ